MVKCVKHPKYKGKKFPKHECEECAALYLALHKAPRMPVKGTKVFKDKTKYDRKRIGRLRTEG